MIEHSFEHKRYVQKVKEKFGKDVKVLGEYVSAVENLLHKYVPTGIKFTMRPADLLYRGLTQKSRGIKRYKKPKKLVCPQRKTESYKKELKEKTDGEIICLEPYKNFTTKILHKNTITKEIWKTSPSSILAGHRHSVKMAATLRKGTVVRGQEGGVKRTLTHEDYCQRVADRYENELKILDKYQNYHTKLRHKHIPTGFIWFVVPRTVLKDDKFGNKYQPWSGHRNSSKPAIQWLNYMSKKLHMKIQHAKNGGEHFIHYFDKEFGKNKHFRVDGYNARKKIVFEFLGDAYHGNLELFYTNDYPHPHNKNKSAIELYCEWLRRKSILLDLGYKVIETWENDFKRDILPLLNK